jgi:hypothetical protein
MPDNMEEIGKHQHLAFHEQIDAVRMLRKIDPGFAEICNDFEEIAAHLAALPSNSGSNPDLVSTLEALQEEILQRLQVVGG